LAGSAPPDGPLAVLRASLAEQLSALRGVSPSELPAALLDVAVQRFAVGPGAEVHLVLPADWEALRHEEGGAGRPVPYWARPWPSGLELARALAAAPPRAGADRLRVLELGCGLGAPSIVAARTGARVLATDGAPDAVAFAAHALALNEVEAEVAHVDWGAHGEALVARGPFDLVLAADVLYTKANVAAALTLWPRLLAPGGELWLADPRRAGARDALAATRGTFAVAASELGEGVALHRLTRAHPGV
jgi:predicted nicotinamide N-methyase